MILTKYLKIHPKIRFLIKKGKSQNANFLRKTPQMRFFIDDWSRTPPLYFSSTPDKRESVI